MTRIRSVNSIKKNNKPAFKHIQFTIFCSYPSLANLSTCFSFIFKHEKKKKLKYSMDNSCKQISENSYCSYYLQISNLDLLLKIQMLLSMDW